MALDIRPFKGDVTSIQFTIWLEDLYKKLQSAAIGDLSSYVPKNAAITGATKTKITYNANGLVTAGADATTADFADSTDKRYVTDAKLVVIGNTSGTNAGDVTIGTANGLSLTGQALSLQAATNSVPGALTAADHTTFASKLGAVTTDVTLTGTGTSTDPLTVVPTGSGFPLSADADFAGYKAVAMACDNGTSFPASPATGQWFYRSDIKTLFIYEGAWKAIISFGAVNLYVDGTNGTNAVGQGYSSGAGATNTIQYAIDLIPPINGGNVIINASAENYAETLIIQGKSFSGNYSITIQGAATASVLSITTVSSATQGSGSTDGTITVNSSGWTTDAYKGKWLTFASNTTTVALRNKIYLVLTNSNATNGILKIVGTFAAAPTNTDTFTIQDNTTTVTGFITSQYLQASIIVNNIKITNSVLVTALAYAFEYASLVLNYCEVYVSGGGSAGVEANFYSNVYPMYCYVHGSFARGVYSVTGSSVFPTNILVDGGTTAADSAGRSAITNNGTNNIYQNCATGIIVRALSTFGFNTFATITNCTLGININTGSQLSSYTSSSVVFSGCTNNFQAEGFYSSVGAFRTSTVKIEGSIALVAGVGVVTLTNPASFTSATSYTVLVSRTITTALIGVVNNSGTQFTITSANLLDTDTVRFVCMGY